MKTNEGDLDIKGEAILFLTSTELKGKLVKIPMLGY